MQFPAGVSSMPWALPEITQWLVNPLAIFSVVFHVSSNEGRAFSICLSGAVVDFSIITFCRDSSWWASEKVSRMVGKVLGVATDRASRLKSFEESPIKHSYHWTGFPHSH